MKKIIFLLLCFIPFLGTVNAQTIEELLNRSAQSGNSLGQEPANLFTSEEMLMLHNYFGDNNPINPLETLADGDVFAANIHHGFPAGCGFFPISGPFNINFINSSNLLYVAGDQDGSGNYYGLTYEGYDWDSHVFKLIKINPVNGAETVIGELGNRPGLHFPAGLSWNYANQTMYAMTSDLDVTNLYTINLTTAELTLIGATGNTKGIWLAIDNFGNGFLADIETNKLYSVDLVSGASSPIGQLGYSLMGVQDADFDPATGILYTVHNFGGGGNNLCSVSTATGEYTTLGSVNNNQAQIGFFSISGTPSGISNNSLEGFSFYPNPAVDVVYLESVGNIENVIIYNLLGQQIITSNINSTNTQLDVSALNTGIYVMKVQVNGEIGSYKFIKN